METKARIKGLPVYRLTGVTTDNVSVIKSAEMWVHYPWLGDDGWCLAVPDQWREAVMTSLGRHGIGLQTTSELPKRSNALFNLGVVGGVVVAYAFAAVMANVDPGNDRATFVSGLIGIAAPFVAIMMFNHRARGGACYGTLVAPVSSPRGGGLDSDRSSSDSVPRYVGSLSGTGTTEHGLYAD